MINIGVTKRIILASEIRFHIHYLADVVIHFQLIIYTKIDFKSSLFFTKNKRQILRVLNSYYITILAHLVSETYVFHITLEEELHHE
jgi:hypothetical protein